MGDRAEHERFLIVLSFIAMIEPPDGGFGEAPARWWTGRSGGLRLPACSLNRHTATGMPNRQHRPLARLECPLESQDAERLAGSFAAHRRRDMKGRRHGQAAENRRNSAEMAYENGGFPPIVLGNDSGARPGNVAGRGRRRGGKEVGPKAPQPGRSGPAAPAR